MDPWVESSDKLTCRYVANVGNMFEGLTKKPPNCFQNQAGTKLRNVTSQDQLQPTMNQNNTIAMNALEESEDTCLEVALKGISARKSVIKVRDPPQERDICS